MYWPFVLHIRLTTACNADCAYCSSSAGAGPTMMVDDFKKSVDFIIGKLRSRLPDNSRRHLSIQYIGGEILTVPPEVLSECVFYARESFGRLFDEVRDGVQSNLISSEVRLQRLRVLFGNRIGTSVDHCSGQRTVNGDPNVYKVMFQRSQAWLKERRIAPGGVFVVDRKGLPYLGEEIATAEAGGYALTLRPVFNGLNVIAPAEAGEQAERIGEAAACWLKSGTVPVEPFHHLLSARLATRHGLDIAGGQTQACPFQTDCGKHSLDLEPNGDIYLCQDMADSGLMRIGNGVTGEWDESVLAAIERREDLLPADCKACDYLADCRGGCMSEARAIDGKSPHCATWKAIFRAIDGAIADHGPQSMKAWADQLEQKHPQ